MSEQTAVRDDLTISDGTDRGTRLTKRRKSRSIHVYLKPGMREDDLLLAIWDVTTQAGRPQDVYRRLLLEGVKRMVENGDMPLSIMKDPTVARHLDVLGDIDRDRRQVLVLAPQTYPGDRPVVRPGQSGLPPQAAYRPAPATSTSPAESNENSEASPRTKDSSQGLKRRGLDPNLM